MTAIERLLATAQAEAGYLEKRSNSKLDSKTDNAGDRNYTKYMRDLDAIGFYNTPKQGFEWCAGFVHWCFVQTFGAELARTMLCLPVKSMGAGCRYAAQYFKVKGQFYKTAPQVGDQVFFVKRDSSGAIVSWTHTALITAVKGNMIYTIEGNTSAAKGVEANGGGVFAKQYNIYYTNIGGYGRPDYSLADEGDKEETMTDKEIYEAYQRYTTSLTVPKWAEGELAEAVALGITDGSNPTQPIPRYQAAIMTLRAVKAARQ